MTIRIKDTGTTYNKRITLERYMMDKLTLVNEEGLLKQQTYSKNRYNIWTNENEWYVTNEPEEHLDNIAMKLAKVNRPKSILAFTYKDMSLADRIEELNEVDEIDILFDSEKGLIRTPPEYKGTKKANGLKDRLQKKYDLIIIRHYIEHFSKPRNIISILKSMLKTNGIIYIEVPDTQRFIEKENPLFMWEKHLVYFTSDSLKSTIQSCGLQAIDMDIVGNDIEPAICTICKVSHIEIKFDKPNLISTKKEIEKNTAKYIKSWRETLMRSEGDIIIVGAGHNSDRFLQLIDQYDKNLCVVDDNKERQGKFLLNLKDEIVEFDKIKNKTNPLILSGCHDRNFEAIEKRIKSINSTATIKNIFTTPNSND